MSGEVADQAASLMAGVKSLNKAVATAADTELASGATMHYYNSFPSFRTTISQERERLQALLQRIEAHGRRGKRKRGDASVVTLGDPDDAAEWLEEVIDNQLESVDAALQAAAVQLNAQGGGGGIDAVGGEGSAAGVATELAPSQPRRNAKRGFLHQFSRHNDTPRPQDSFEDVLDNSHEPFVPKVGHLEAVLGHPVLPQPRGRIAAPPVVSGDRVGRVSAYLHRSGGEPGSRLPGGGQAGFYSHPLQAQLDALTYQPWQLQAGTPQPPRELDETPCEWVDTPAALEAMAAALLGAREVAVDLEAHSYRSFQGFACLMQLSTRERDWLVDALVLRSHIGPALARVFADPAIVKVLHGADSDILWLQRDFGLYILNMIDTGQAARCLAHPSAGLAYALSHYCGVKADKRFQLADWRVRPLSEDMMSYARADTHYLLYIYDKLRAECVAKGDEVAAAYAVPLPAGGPGGVLGTVLERSRLLCCQTYEKEQYSDSSHLRLLERGDVQLSPRDIAVLGGLYCWRDRVAREEDESPGYVLPRAVLMKLARSAPGSARELLAAVGGSCPVVMRRAAEVLEVVTAAQAQAADEPGSQPAAVCVQHIRFDAPDGSAVPDAAAQVEGLEREQGISAVSPPAPKRLKPLTQRTGSSIAAGTPSAAGPPAIAAPPVAAAALPAGSAEAVAAPALLVARAVKPLRIGGSAGLAQVAAAGAAAPPPLEAVAVHPRVLGRPAQRVSAFGTALGSATPAAGAAPPSDAAAAMAGVDGAVARIRASMSLACHQAAAPATERAAAAEACSEAAVGTDASASTAAAPDIDPAAVSFVRARTSASAIRQLVDGMRRQGAAEAGGAQAAQPSSGHVSTDLAARGSASEGAAQGRGQEEEEKEEEQEEQDFLPLSLSEQYQRRRQVQYRGPGLQGAVGGTRQPAPRTAVPAAGGEDTAQQALRATGLEDSSSGSEDEDGDLRGMGAGRAPAAALDYEAMRAQQPGLNLDLALAGTARSKAGQDTGRQASGRGRAGVARGGQGGRNSGRGGDGGRRGGKSFNPFASLEKGPKGSSKGKPGARFGNKSATFAK